MRPAPVRDSIVKEKKTIDVSVLHGNPLKGPPSPELDEAWSQLLMNANIRVSAEDLEKAGVESIPLNDGSGKYYAILDVYHQLHCLKYIRHYMYKVRVYPSRPTRFASVANMPNRIFTTMFSHGLQPTWITALIVYGKT